MKKKLKEKKDNKFFFIPICKKNYIPIPNVILRSSLFGIVKKGRRIYEKNVLKATTKEYKISFTGESLEQSDLDVWLGCINYMKNYLIEKIFLFSKYKLLKFIGRSSGKSDLIWLNNSLLRMQACVIKIYIKYNNKIYSYSGNLINECYKKENDKNFFIKFNEKIYSLFFKDGWTSINTYIRFKLKGKPLSQWLYSFYSSHKFPFPIKIETLQKLSGSKTEKNKKFKQMLKKSFKEISLITNWNFHIDTNNLILISKLESKREI